MLPVSRYPLPCQQAIAAYAGAITRWAAAACEDREAVCQEVCVAVLAGKDPRRAVPSALGIWRPKGNKWWVGSDPTLHPGVEADDLVDVLALPNDEPAASPELGIGGTADVARRLRVTRRRAQQLVAAQRARVAQNGDLFLGKRA